MERSISLVLLGLSLILLFVTVSNEPQITIAKDERPTSILNGSPHARSLLMARANPVNTSPCDNPTQQIELRPDLDLQAVIDEAPPGSVIELRPVAGQRYRIPEQGLVITKDLALCGSDPARVELRGPVVPNPALAEEVLGRPDGRGSAMLWIMAETPIEVRLENVVLAEAFPEDLSRVPFPHQPFGIVVAGQATVTLRNVLLREHWVGLGVIDGAQATLEDVGILQEYVGIVVRNSARVELSRVRIAGTSTGISIEGDRIQVAIRESWILDNGTGLSVFVVTFPRVVQVVIERTSIAGNEEGIRAEKAELAPADERTRDWFPADITLRQSRLLSNVWGVIVGGWNRVVLEDTEVAYNRLDGVGIDPGLPPSEDTSPFWRGGSLVLRGSRVHENGGYGVVLFVEECRGSRPLEDAFLGDLEIRDSEIFDNRLGDLCPEDFPWSEGSTNP